MHLHAFSIAGCCLVALTLGARQAAPQSDPLHVDARDRNLYVDGTQTSGPFLKKFTRNVLLDQKDIWTSPFHINRSSAKWWILAGVGTTVLLAVDHPVSQALPRTGASVNFGNNFSRAGQWYSVFPFAGALYATGLGTDDQKLQETGALGLQALVGADIVANAVKLVVRRQRPGDGDHGGHFEKGGSSFPSAHSTQAWAIASVVADEYGNHKWVPVAAYAYASAVSLSRVLAQEHFTSDVFVGGAIGFFIGRYVVRTERKHLDHLRSHRSGLFTPAIEPEFGPATKTITLTWSL